MNSAAIESAMHATYQGSKPFQEIVAQLIAAGVEYYFVDYFELRTTFYGSGASVSSPLPYQDLPPIAETFDAAEVKSAILASQRDGQIHCDFSRRATAAGVQGYFAFLRGGRVTYLGRQGDQHTEWFPGAAPARL